MSSEAKYPFKEQDARFVQQARELAEMTGNRMADYIVKGHKAVNAIYQKMQKRLKRSKS